jgi:hypothetical protein
LHDAVRVASLRPSAREGLPLQFTGWGASIQFPAHQIADRANGVKDAHKALKLLNDNRFKEQGSGMTHPIFDLVTKLDGGHLAYALSRHRPDSILVSVTVVGQRIEIDVFDDGHMEISRFVGNEDIEGGAELIDAILASAA